jgi:hypothetical protein
MSKALRMSLVVLILAGASFAVNVSVSAPANGAMVSPSFTLQASASSSAAITGWRVYIDAIGAYAAGAESALTAPLSIGAGSHNIIVTAWDARGAYQSVALRVTSATPEVIATAGLNAPAMATAGPNAPANAATFAHLERETGWSKCSSAACSGGLGSAYNYYFAPNQTSPSLSGSSALFYIDGAAYTDDLFALRVGVNDNFSHFILDFWVYPDSSTVAGAEALEYDLVQVSGGRKYAWATECNYVTRTWDTWNEVSQRWIHSNAVCQPLAPNTWHHIKWAVERAGAQTHYLNVTLDGTTQTINSAYAYQPAPATNWTEGAIVAQVQEDIAVKPGAFREWIDEATVYGW